LSGILRPSYIFFDDYFIRKIQLRRVIHREGEIRTARDQVCRVQAAYKVDGDGMRSAVEFISLADLRGGASNI
jgi:hypothetical protein